MLFSPKVRLIGVFLFLVVVALLALKFLPVGTIIPIFKPSPSSLWLTIGKDQFSYADSQYLQSVYLPETTSQLENLAQERAIVLQEAEKANLLTVDPALFAPNKNWQVYNEAFEKAREALLEKIEQISVEGIYMYFYNGIEPTSMSLQQAKDFTLNKMKALREDLLGSRKTFLQAAQTISNDTTLSGIDEVYQTNAYARLDNRTRFAKIDSGLTDLDNDLIWKLEEGGFTPIFLGLEKNSNDETPKESYWVVYHVLEKKGTLPPYLEWLKEMKGKYGKKVH